MKSLNVRNVGAQELFDMLGTQHARKVDVVVKASDLQASGGKIEVSGHDPLMTDMGVTEVNGLYSPNDVMIGHLAEVFKLSLRDVRRFAAERPDIFDAVINGLLHGNTWGKVAEPEHKPDARSFLFRAYAGDDEDPEPQGRALLSDRYGIVDNIDAMTAVLAGVRDAIGDGQKITVSGADLTDRRMFVRFTAPTVEIGARALLEGYRSPFDMPGGPQRAGGNGGWSLGAGLEAARREGMGYEPGTEPIMWAGFELSNSEVGGGAFSLTPRAEIKVCRNGLKIVADAERTIHLGAKLEHGVIKWSQDTQRKQLDLIKAKTRDAVRTFLDPAYWEAKVAQIAKASERWVTPDEKAIEPMAKALGYSEAERTEIFRHFVLGGQLNALGVMNAVTSVAQTLPDADRAAELEATALKVLDHV